MYLTELTKRHCLLLAATEVSTSIAKTNKSSRVASPILKLLQEWGPGGDHS